LAKAGYCSTVNIEALRRMVAEERRLTVDFSKDYDSYEIPEFIFIKKDGNRCVYGFDQEKVKAIGTDKVRFC
jgi:hypothetical protein